MKRLGEVSVRKRIFVFSLFLCVFFLFVSCSQQKGASRTVELGKTVFGVYHLDPETGLPDFKDKDITFVGDVQELKPEIGASKWEDMRLEHIRKVEEELHVNFVFEHEDVIVRKLQAMAMSGVGDIDVCYCDGVFISSMYKTGVFADLKTIEAIDLSNTEKYGTEALLKFAEYQGGIYSLYGSGSFYWPENLGNISNAILINDDLIEEFGAVHPLELYEKENWNLATFKSYLPRVTDNDYTHKIYGLDATHGGCFSLAKSALYASGVGVVQPDSSENYSFGYTSAEAFKAMEWVKSLCAMKDCVILDQRDPEPIFASGKATMFIGNSSFLIEPDSEISRSLENLSFICFPFGNDVPFGSLTPSYYDVPKCTSIIKNGDEQVTGYILDYLLEPMEGNGNGEYLDYLRSYFFPGQNQSFDLFFEQMKNASYSYNAQLIQVNARIDNALNAVTRGQKTPIEAFLPIENAVNTEIEENIKK